MTVGELKAALANFDDNRPLQVWIPGTRIELKHVFEFGRPETGPDPHPVLIEGNVISGGLE
jgi:hypothetical protein